MKPPSRVVTATMRSKPDVTDELKKKKNSSDEKSDSVNKVNHVEQRSSKRAVSQAKEKTLEKVSEQSSQMVTRRSSRRMENASAPRRAETGQQRREEVETDGIDGKARDDSNEITIEIEIEKSRNSDEAEERESENEERGDDGEEAVSSDRSILKDDVKETMQKSVDRLVRSTKGVEYFKPFSCPICNVTFQYKYPHLSKGKLKSHMKNHEGIIYKCDKCEKAFNNLVNLRNHKRGMHNNEFLCSDCGKTFYNKPNLERHVASIHRNVEERKLPYICGECGRRFHNNKHLQGHQISDHQASDKRYKCDSCGRSYVYEKSLQNHKCPPKVYTTEELQQMGCSDAESAVTKHGDQFMCKICRVCAKTKARAKMHAKMHFQEFFFHCEYCGKGFNGSADLHAHINVIHHKQKEHMCHICGENRTFSYRRSVQEHIRKVHKMNWLIYTHKHNLDNSGHPMSEEQLFKMRQHEQAQQELQQARHMESAERYALKQKVKIVDSALQQGDMTTPLEILATIGQGLMTAQEQGEEVVQHFQLAAAEEVVSATSHDDRPHEAANIIPIAVESAGIPVTVAEEAPCTSGEENTEHVCAMQGETVALVHDDDQEVVQEQYITIDPQQGEILSVQTDPLDSNTIIIEYANSDQQAN